MGDGTFITTINVSFSLNISTFLLNLNENNIATTEYFDFEGGQVVLFKDGYEIYLTFEYFEIQSNNILASNLTLISAGRDPFIEGTYEFEYYGPVNKPKILIIDFEITDIESHKNIKISEFLHWRQVKLEKTDHTCPYKKEKNTKELSPKIQQTQKSITRISQKTTKIERLSSPKQETNTRKENILQEELTKNKVPLYNKSSKIDTDMTGMQTIAVNAQSTGESRNIKILIGLGVPLILIFLALGAIFAVTKFANKTRPSQ